MQKNFIFRRKSQTKYFGSNYTISFDPPTDRNFRLPLWQAYILLKPEYKKRLFNRVNHISFDRFCSFTVSNANNFFRNGMFHQLSQYKPVYSYGRYLTNNLELQNASKGRYWRDAKDDFFKNYKHKFAITYENNSYPYYTTEKLMDGFLAGSISIYFGDPKVGKDQNEKAFLNAQKLGTHIHDVISLLDQDKAKFDEMYNQPVFTEFQKEKLENNLEAFETWLISIIK